eukprot:m.135446 g.135446  ORF g.135446 m.135446 type:complete len:364 (+) comp13974_c0_seq1:113-1204(+)
MAKLSFGSKLIWLAAFIALASSTTTWRVLIRFGDTPTFIVFPSTNDAGAGFIDLGGGDTGVITDDGQDAIEQQIQNATNGNSNVTTVSFTNDTGTFVGEFEITTDGDENPLNVDELTEFTITFLDKDGNEQNITFTLNPNDPENPIAVSPVRPDPTPIILGVILGILGLALVLVLVKVGLKRYKQNKATNPTSDDDVELGQIERAPTTKQPEPTTTPAEDVKKTEPMPEPAPVQVAPEPTPEPQPTPVEPVQEPEKVEDVQDEPQSTPEAEPTPDSTPAADSTPQVAAATAVAEQEVAKILAEATEEAVAGPSDGEESGDGKNTSKKATYLWNATANAVADPPPGGRPVDPQDMAEVVEKTTQ